VLVSEAALDKFGRTILLNEQSTDRLFAVADGSGGWAFRQNCANPRENVYRSLAVDGNGTVWCGSPESRGLIGYNDKNTPSQDDDICNKIMSSNSQLQDNVVTSLATDQNGALWIGTAKGLSVVSSPWNLANTTIPFVRRVSVMSSTYINDVFVDALNYKWIATNNGVFVLDESGIEVLATITTATSPLLDNNVRSIAIDDATGLAYFGTLKGCSVAKTSSMRPLPSFDVSCYPQPFKAGSQTQLVIDGLAPDSEVRIMTSGGILVSAIAARGRQALWDGRDVYGNMVPPGIYVASVSSASTSSSSVLKIAVTR
jgi:ligand-binding sensor domain-containing protein